MMKKCLLFLIISGIIFIIALIKIDYLIINKNKEFKGYKYLGKCNVTAYEASEVSCGYSADGKTSLNMRVAKGLVAVDPRQILPGTILYIKDYEPIRELNVSGYYIAADRGSLITNNCIDIFMHTVKECQNFGRKKLQVWEVLLK